MLFLHPMWHHESQRIGKQKCTPVGYTLHVIAELIGFFGLLLLFIVLADWIRKVFTGGFHASLIWLLALPLGLGFISEILYQFSWELALRKGFSYNDEQCEASWIEDGQRHTYKYSA